MDFLYLWIILSKALIISDFKCGSSKCCQKRHHAMNVQQKYLFFQGTTVSSFSLLRSVCIWYIFCSFLLKNSFSRTQNRCLTAWFKWNGSPHTYSHFFASFISATLTDEHLIKCEITFWYYSYQSHPLHGFIHCIIWQHLKSCLTDYSETFMKTDEDIIAGKNMYTFNMQ